MGLPLRRTYTFAGLLDEWGVNQRTVDVPTAQNCPRSEQVSLARFIANWTTSDHLDGVMDKVLDAIAKLQ